jgi:hypothetical protein
MTYFILARDGTSRIVLKRENREAAEKKARELTDLGWFDVQIEEEAQIGGSESSKEVASRMATTIQQASWSGHDRGCSKHPAFPAPSLIEGDASKPRTPIAPRERMFMFRFRQGIRGWLGNRQQSEKALKNEW